CAFAPFPGHLFSRVLGAGAPSSLLVSPLPFDLSARPLLSPCYYFLLRVDASASGRCQTVAAAIVLPGLMIFFFSIRRRHTRLVSDWSSDVCSSDLQFLQRARDLVHQVVLEDLTLALVEQPFAVGDLLGERARKLWHRRRAAAEDDLHLDPLLLHGRRGVVAVAAQRVAQGAQLVGHSALGPLPGGLVLGSIYERLLE